MKSFVRKQLCRGERTSEPVPSSLALPSREFPAVLMAAQ